MTLDVFTAMLGWCTAINLGLLLWWFLFVVIAHDWTYRMHTKWFEISPLQFDAIHYAGMGIFKMVVIVFNLVPYLALRIVA
jgi:hypothetical protein